MDELLEAERFNAELDELLERPGSPVSSKFRPELEVAERLLASELNAESRIKKTLAASLDARAEKVFHPGLVARFLPRPRTLALCGALASAMLAPVVFHLVGESDDRAESLQAGFSSNASPMFEAGEPYQVVGLARGGIPGDGMDVVTPLNARDPSNLIMSGGDIKGVAGGSSGGDDRSVAAPPASSGRPRENQFQTPLDQPLSTFSVEVDRAAFAEARRLLRAGTMPKPETIRIEAFINAFGYSYLDPNPGEAVSVMTDVAACPWTAGHKLVRIGLLTRRGASDVKLQVEFNPARVQAYRLIGYEPGKLKAREFNDDETPGGELEPGQSVTALYEIVPPGMDIPGYSVDGLKYQKTPRLSSAAGSRELLTLKVRAKPAGGIQSRLLTRTVLDSDLAWRRAPPNFRTAMAAAGFGMLLRRSEYRGKATYGMLRDVAGPDPELLNLLERARRLDSLHVPGLLTD